jgi:hypothetical protein
MKQFNRKSNVKTDDAIYYVFDILPLSEFIAGQVKEETEPALRATRQVPGRQQIES